MEVRRDRGRGGGEGNVDMRSRVARCIIHASSGCCLPLLKRFQHLRPVFFFFLWTSKRLKGKRQTGFRTRSWHSVTRGKRQFWEGNSSLEDYSRRLSLRVSEAEERGGRATRPRGGQVARREFPPSGFHVGGVSSINSRRASGNQVKKTKFGRRFLVTRIRCPSLSVKREGARALTVSSSIVSDIHSGSSRRGVSPRGRHVLLVLLESPLPPAIASCVSEWFPHGELQ